MSDDSDAWSTLALIVFMGFVAYSCHKPLEERDDYKSGYNVGHADGYYQAKEEVCDQIEDNLNSEARDAVCN